MYWETIKLFREIIFLRLHTSNYKDTRIIKIIKNFKDKGKMNIY